VITKSYGKIFLNSDRRVSEIEKGNFNAKFSRNDVNRPFKSHNFVGLLSELAGILL
jgi:hypothetical protein